MQILSFEDGSDFLEERHYQVALNSYRGNGGGGHLTEGAGIPGEELSSRITWSTQKDLRYFLMDHLAKKDSLEANTLDNWSLVPEGLAGKAMEADRRIMEKAFGLHN